MDPEAMGQLVRQHALWRRARRYGIAAYLFATLCAVVTVAQLFVPNPLTFVQIGMTCFLLGRMSVRRDDAGIGKRALWAQMSLIAGAAAVRRTTWSRDDRRFETLVTTLGVDILKSGAQGRALYLERALELMPTLSAEMAPAAAAHIALLAHGTRVSRADRRRMAGA